MAAESVQVGVGVGGDQAIAPIYGHRPFFCTGRDFVYDMENGFLSCGVSWVTRRRAGSGPPTKERFFYGATAVRHGWRRHGRAPGPGRWLPPTIAQVFKEGYAPLADCPPSSA